MRRAALYLRVSTAKRISIDGQADFSQRPELQEEPLRQLAEQRGWSIAAVYSDRISGGRESRPGLRDLMEAARRGEFDAVLVWRFDRFARSTKHLVDALAEFQALGIGFVSHRAAIDPGTPMGRAMFAMIGAIAQLERDLIAERVKLGMDHARKAGTRSGRPIGRPRVIFSRDLALKLRKEGKSWREMGLIFEMPLSTVRNRYLELLETEGPSKTL